MARLTPERRAFIEQLAGEILAHYPRGRLIIAVDGPEAAGKTIFADDLARELEKRGHATFRASIDGFHRPSRVPLSQGQVLARGLLRRQLRLLGAAPRAARAVPAGRVDGVRDGGLRLRARRAGRAEVADRAAGPLPRHRRRVPQPTGAAGQLELHDLGGRGCRSARRPMLARDGIEPGSEHALRHEGAQELYERDARPRDAASAIVDNTDPDRPKRIFEDSC